MKAIAANGALNGVPHVGQERQEPRRENYIASALFPPNCCVAFIILY